MLKKNMTIISLLLILPSTQAMAWGLRGHQVVCEAAIFAVKDESLSLFLKSRVPVVTHLCNLPDTSWRSLAPELTALGSPTHYVNPEVTGLDPQFFKTDYRALQKELEGQDNKIKPGQKIISLPRDFGSLWWRVDQFVRRGTEFASLADKAKIPTNRSEEQDEKLAFNQAIFEWMVNTSVMGHFVGDASQPLHSTADYDGYGTGHGGLHGFYEEVMVDLQDEKLTQDVINEARRLLKQAETLPKSKRDPAKNTALAFLLAETPVEKMRALSQVSLADLSDLTKADVVKKPSEKLTDKGMEVKKVAEREITPQRIKAFRRFQVRHMGRSAALLAQLWGQIYERGGKPDLKAYKAHRFPFQPDFVVPDYFDLKTPPKTH